MRSLFHPANRRREFGALSGRPDRAGNYRLVLPVSELARRLTSSDEMRLGEEVVRRLPH